MLDSQSSDRELFEALAIEARSAETRLGSELDRRIAIDRRLLDRRVDRLLLFLFLDLAALATIILLW